MINNVVEMGRLTADPELKQTPNGVSVTSFTLAIDRSYCKPGAERQCDFIDFVAWKNTAEFVCKYFKKGQLMAVTGAIQVRTYTDKGGNKRKAVEVLANQVSFCESKKEGSGAESNPYPAGDKPAANPDAAKEQNEDTSGNEDLPF